MNIFDLDRSVVGDYARFARSFTEVRAADLDEKIKHAYGEGRFWPEPMIRLNPPLVADVDAAFDCGLIFFDDTGAILLSGASADGAGSLSEHADRLLSPAHRQAWRLPCLAPGAPVSRVKGKMGPMEQSNEPRNAMEKEAARTRLAVALAYAALAHGDQLRKGTDIPYISHPMSVAALVMEYGGDEDQAIAGLLHDVLEDCGAWHEAPIRDTFGDRVADIVLACTDGVKDAAGNKPPWRERKERYLAHLESADAATLLVSACDKLHNARAIAADLLAGHDVFARFSASRHETLWYYQALCEVFRARLGANAPLLRQFAAAVAALSAG